MQKDEHETAWKYAKWKYNIDTSGLDAISYDENLSGDAAVTVGSECRLGDDAFQSENWCASKLGHENVHGGQDRIFKKYKENAAEVEAYGWELLHKGKTGISALNVEGVADFFIDYYEKCWNQDTKDEYEELYNQYK